MLFYSLFSIVNLFFSFFTLIFVFILHSSKDQMLHTPFYSLFKVNALYGVLNMLFRVDFDLLCIRDSNIIIVTTAISTIGIIAFCMGNFYIEILRFTIVRNPIQDEHSFSRPKLYMMFLIQFLVPSLVAFTAMKPGVEVEYEDCLAFIEYDDRSTAILTLVHSAYALPAIVLSLLIVRELRRIKQRTMSEAISTTGKQDHLVWYTVACTVVQVCKCVSISTRSAFLLMHMEGAHRISKSIVFPMNILYINSPTLLLIYFSISVRRRLFYLVSRKPDTGVHSVTMGKAVS